MDQIKIGKFIADKRKEKGMTQMQLAEKLSITDRAVSKWETGKAMPDSSIMLDLCRALQISVNDLLCGEVVTVNEYNEKLEEQLLEMVREKENADKRLLTLEIVIGFTVSALMITMIMLAAYVQMETWMRVLLIALGVIPFVIGLAYAIRIEQIAGYYECAKCHHKYVPKFSTVLWSMHMCRTRYMRCPKCHEKSWQKKRVSKD